MPDPRPGPLSPDEIARIATEVSALMQLDRTRHQIGSGVELAAQANIPDYIASIFEAAGAIGTELSNAALYDAVNKRIAALQAQLYVMRIELENRSARDPAQLFEDPRVIAAYGARMDGLTAMEKTFSFEPALLAHGWYPAESNGVRWYRWMRPVDMAVACIPHLGLVDQVIEIVGQILDPAQLEDLQIGLGDLSADIQADADLPTRFTARLALRADQMPSASLLPVEFRMQDFRQPDPQDTRLLGVSISRFTCRPGLGADPDETPGDATADDT